MGEVQQKMPLSEMAQSLLKQSTDSQNTSPAARVALKRTPSGMLIPQEGPSPRSLCRSHSGLSQKRKASSSPQSSHRRQSRHKPLGLTLEIPTNLCLSPSTSWQSLPEADRPPWASDLDQPSIARAWVRGLGNIRLLAIDFDATCVKVETRGQWRGSAASLAARFRPEIREVIAQACSIGLRVAVVSFSAQRTLIAEVLAHVLPDCAAQVMLRAGSPQSIVLASQEQCGLDKKNKQRHIAAVLEELAGRNEQIGLSQVMLIDDDFRNVEGARANGCIAVWFNPEEPLSFACDACQARMEMGLLGGCDHQFPSDSEGLPKPRHSCGPPKR